MRIHVSAEKPERARVDALVLPVYADGVASASVEAVDRKLGGVIDELRSGNELRGRENEEHTLVANGKIGAKRVVVVGIGAKGDVTPATIARYAGVGVRTAARRGLSTLALVLPDDLPFDAAEVGEAATEGALMATFDPSPYRSRREAKPDAVKSVTLIAAPSTAKQLGKGVERGTILGEAANLAREMVNAPSNDMTPTNIADRAKALAKKYGLKATILDTAGMKKLGMGSFLSVAAGSDEPPKMIALEYRGAPKSKTVLGLVGKGITFDTGGISLKPAQDMDAMKGDMAGGAAVVAAMSAIGQLKPAANVIGIIAATENMPSGRATKPGDVVRAMNGKSIEIINTDAEGRLVLADGLCWARKLGATHLVDIATLTGAAVVALGHTTTGVMSNDRELVDLFHRATRPFGERYWELPLFPEYADLIKSPIADMKNSGGRPAGTIFGAMFIKEFVDDQPWIHLDIAGTSWAERDNGHIVKGPTAVGMRPMVALAELIGKSDVHKRADDAAQRRFMQGSLSTAASTNGAPKRKRATTKRKKK
ncbi:MAG TPA: leucyl aminopeptidase [Candidatus Eremiobacteraceae bacterium]|nr:leucyl aminopeptidase [Candidatus Eremiobacteraceae bacterium]